MPDNFGVRSPFGEEFPVTLVKTIDTNSIIEEYQRLYKTNVSLYFTGIDEIELYQCDKTGYRFFYPFNLTGDDQFYAQLQKENEWYYSPNSWEYQFAQKYIPAHGKILEVGCGVGHFLEIISNHKLECIGLDLNIKAIEQANNAGLDVRNELVQDHAKHEAEQYDVVCSFQVLEHIPDIMPFLEANIACLKPGGQLIIAVPNDDSYSSLDFNVLNMPPHHMGCWTSDTLKYLTKLFKLKVEGLEFEPLKRNRGYYHYYKRVMAASYKKRFMIPEAYGERLANFMMKYYSKKFKGYTVAICFRKL